MKTVAKKHAADVGLDRAKNEERSVQKSTNRQDEEAQAEEAKKGSVEVTDLDIRNLKYISDNRDCSCTVILKGDGRGVIVGDPGVSNIGKLGSYGDNMSLRDAADVAFAVSKAVIELTGIKALRPNTRLGLARGDMAPQPFDLEDAHEQAWKQFDRDLRDWQRVYVESARPDSKMEDPGKRPVEPETELSALMLGILTTNDFQRIIMGFRYNALDPIVMEKVEGGDEGNS